MSGSVFGGLMFAYKFTALSESRLWECRVFTVFGDRLVRFVFYLQGLLTAVYGNIVFSHSKMHAWHKSLVLFPLTFDLFLLLEAL